MRTVATKIAVAELPSQAGETNAAAIQCARALLGLSLTGLAALTAVIGVGKFRNGTEEGTVGGRARYPKK